jgi:hypothetical protein
MRASWSHQTHKSCHEQGAQAGHIKHTNSVTNNARKLVTPNTQIMSRTRRASWSHQKHKFCHEQCAQAGHTKHTNHVTNKMRKLFTPHIIMCRGPFVTTLCGGPRRLGVQTRIPCKLRFNLDTVDLIDESMNCDTFLVMMVHANLAMFTLVTSHQRRPMEANSLP